LAGNTGLIGVVDSSISTVGSAESDGGLTPDAACAGEILESERVPLDMYFLVDTSGSMGEQVQGGSKWQVVSGALVAFLQDPANADIGAGIGYFPLSAPTNCTAGQNGCFCIPIVNICFSLAGGSCNVPEYATPSVALSLPPNHAAVVTDISSHGPGGGTPTRPALEGAVQYASAWAQSSGRKTVVVLATDGDPTGCTQNNAQDVANVAANALAGANHIQTFVVGVGRSLTSLNLIAQSGGTGQAILVDTGGNLGQAIADALKQIRGQALPCDFIIPARSPSQGLIDPHQVNVRYTPMGAGAVIVPMTLNGDPANCGGADGWYYDNPSAPTTIKLCDTTCQSLMGGRVEIEFGCKTVTVVR
jgi:Mg-chelatase subunit ChlD